MFVFLLFVAAAITKPVKVMKFMGVAFIFG
jgi:hypothetical protein